MSNLEELGLVSKGMDCLSIFNRLFSKALRKKDFESARDWMHKYIGALMVLADMEKISPTTAQFLTEKAVQRYRMAKYPGAYEEDT